MKNCEQIIEFFSQARDNRLEKEEKEAFETHLAGCGRCADEWRRYNIMLDAAASEEEVEVSKDFDRILAEKLSRRALSRQWYASPLSWAAVLAVLVIGSHAAGFFLGTSMKSSSLAELRKRIETLETQSSSNQDTGGSLPPYVAYKSSDPRNAALDFVDAAEQTLDDLDFSKEEKLSPKKKKAIKAQFQDWNFPVWADSVEDQLAGIPEPHRRAALAHFQKVSAVLSELHNRIVTSDDWTPVEIRGHIINSGLRKELKQLRPVLHYRIEVRSFGNGNEIFIQKNFGSGNSAESSDMDVKLYITAKQRVIFGDNLGAIKYFEEILRSHPDSELAPWGLIQVVRSMAGNSPLDDFEEFNRKIDAWFNRLPDRTKNKLEGTLERAVEKIHEKFPRR